MDQLREYMSVERKELDTLVEKLRGMTKEVEKVDRKKSFSEEEQKYFKGIKGISNAIVKLLSDDFLGDDMEVTQSYKNIMKEIENVNTSLPMIPSIDNPKSSELMDIVIKSLEI